MSKAQQKSKVMLIKFEKNTLAKWRISSYSSSDPSSRYPPNTHNNKVSSSQLHSDDHSSTVCSEMLSNHYISCNYFLEKFLVMTKCF